MIVVFLGCSAFSLTVRSLAGWRSGGIFFTESSLSRIYVVEVGSRSWLSPVIWRLGFLSLHSPLDLPESLLHQSELSLKIQNVLRLGRKWPILAQLLPGPLRLMDFRWKWRSHHLLVAEACRRPRAPVIMLPRSFDHALSGCLLIWQWLFQSNLKLKKGAGACNLYLQIDYVWYKIQW